ncbi:MAG: hypothetical protein AMXMBFR33_41540 [Candidatus Xenobia bacterium]
MHYLRFLFLLLIAAAVLLSCSGDGPGGGPVTTPNLLPDGPRQLFGRVSLQPIIVVDQADRQEVAANRAQLEAQGDKVATDGSIIVQERSPADFWSVEFGDTVTRTDGAGFFELTVGPGSPSEGFLRHPSDTRLFTRFFVHQLSPEAASAQHLVIPLAFPGPCGMSAREDGNCTGLEPPPELVPDGFVEQPRQDELCASPTRRRAVPTDITTGPRGTYPGRSKSGLICEDKNGPLSAVTSNKYFAYLGSTCNEYVKRGACPNENAFSDIEYNAIIAPFAPLIKDYSATFLSGPLNPSSHLSCPDNHKGRSCQQVQIGDLSVDIQGAITMATGETTLELCPGETIAFVVHNNGNFGMTFVDRTSEEIDGLLTSRGLFSGPGGLELRHYDPITFVPGSGTRYPSYLADRDLTFSAPLGSTPGTTDTFRFTVDGQSVEVSFVIKDCQDAVTPPAQLPSPVDASPTPPP